MVGAPFLLAVGRVVGAVEVEHDVGRQPVTLPLPQVQLPEDHRQPVTGPAIHRVL